MFGLENVEAATKWLEGKCTRTITIRVESGVFYVDFDDDDTVIAGKGISLMDALKSALGKLPKS